ncbi:transposase [candidate division KSB1 bacterium]|nr:transposase [candidate division KSB1 bacterium]
MILISQHFNSKAIEEYARRWEIESLFGCLKTRGFNFKNTHMTKPERLDKLLAILAIAFAWAHLVGEWLHEQIPVKIKKHGRLIKSIFRFRNLAII